MRTRPTPQPVDPGQESVWSYPRPPRVEPTHRRVRVILAGVVIADTTSALRVLETSHPPNYYIPLADIRRDALVPTRKFTFCEYKGEAGYFTVMAGDRREVDAAWYYPDPSPGFDALIGHVAFYPGRMEACYVDDELVQPQPGGFYGGWITGDVVGPFKGERGTEWW
jgi:uncharacterized protein (DUF427 family)